jgi:hypothetical protein
VLPKRCALHPSLSPLQPAKKGARIHGADAMMSQDDAKINGGFAWAADLDYLTVSIYCLRFYSVIFVVNHLEWMRPLMTQSHIQLKLFASLAPFSPENSDRIPIRPGISVRGLLDGLNIPAVKAHLIFINGIKRSLDTRLDGGERVGIFPPVAGG